jgi:hypothetical protein
MHTYEIREKEGTLQMHPFYKGMPEFTKRFHPLHEDFPLYCSLLLKIHTIPMHTILWGKRIKKGELIAQDFRQYEFQLLGNVEDGWGKFHLYIKDKAHFFEHQKAFKSLHDGEWQKIPLTYETMSKMTKEELYIIATDFD